MPMRHPVLSLSVPLGMLGGFGTHVFSIPEWPICLVLCLFSLHYIARKKKATSAPTYISVVTEIYETRDRVTINCRYSEQTITHGSITRFKLSWLTFYARPCSGAKFPFSKFCPIEEF
uniref:Uncharacterized protein n=1 Tax=Amblyomma tuberculatum TaxID=48802 RepID=A0A6M2E592_9ACAR